MKAGAGQPLVAIDTVPVRFRGERLEFGVAKRQYEPHQGSPALPGVLLLAGESGDEPVLRALQSKAGVDADRVLVARQIGWFDGSMRDPRSPTISLATLVVLADDDNGGDQLDWLDAEEVAGLPFDHDAIVSVARSWIGTALWSDWELTRALLGERFTSGTAMSLSDQLGVSYDRANFRRWMEAKGKFRTTQDSSGLRIAGRTTIWAWADEG